MELDLKSEIQEWNWVLDPKWILDLKSEIQRVKLDSGP